MKKVLYIDANIYLRFYDTNSEGFKKLLKSMEEVKDNIFITRQIQDEIERNKLKEFMKSFIQYDKQLEFKTIKLPEHLEAKADKEIKIWNTTTKNLAIEVEKQKNKLKKITEKLINNISENKDEVSQLFHKIFSTAQLADGIQVKKARARKEVGNPPGKNRDPLGDQISWEQLLDKAKTIDEVWIITNDPDYYFEFDKKCYLNSFLTQELRDRNKSIKINCFNTLSEGFLSYSRSEKISALPTDAELSKIINEEKGSNIFQNYILGISESTINLGTTAPSVLNGYTMGILPTSGVATLDPSAWRNKCDGCSKYEKFNTLTDTSNCVAISGGFNSCPSCSRYLCDDCWPRYNPHRLGIVSSLRTRNYNLEKCPKCEESV